MFNLMKPIDPNDYEIAQTLVDFNQVNDPHEKSHSRKRRKDSTDAVIDKNIFLFSEFQKYTHTSPSSSHYPPQDCLIQLPPIRTKNKKVVNEWISEEEEPRTKRKKMHANEKPRWSNPMKHVLLEAIIEQKELADMATFNWAAIGKQVGRAGKACKDQWRRAVLPKLQHMYEEDDNEYDDI